jgi:hypothetical protein
MKVITALALIGINNTHGWTIVEVLGQSRASLFELTTRTVTKHKSAKNPYWLFDPTNPLSFKDINPDGICKTS